MSVETELSQYTVGNGVNNLGRGGGGECRKKWVYRRDGVTRFTSRRTRAAFRLETVNTFHRHRDCVNGPTCYIDYEEIETAKRIRETVDSMVSPSVEDAAEIARVERRD